MGVAMRSNIPLSIELPSLFWKSLTGESTNFQDLEAVDHAVVKHLAEIKEMTRMKRFHLKPLFLTLTQKSNSMNHLIIHFILPFSLEKQLNWFLEV